MRTQTARLHAVSALFILLVYFAILTLAGGCQHVGPRAAFTRDSTDIASPSPTTISTPEPGGLATASGAGAANRTGLSLHGPDGPIAQADDLSVGGTTRTIIVPFGDKLAVFRSGTDETIKIDEASVNGVSFKGLSITQSSSEPTRASNEAYDRLVVYMQSLSADQRAALIAQLETSRDISREAIATIVPLIKLAAGVP
ncbi:MAG: hypothetical protein K2X32_14535 [Phycisphaerales bacterium]|nr:hypothetical protein [Phycisphaerales bacterium]